jgi:prepilin-type N-terminal cleavage/methylation domain-containing protein
MKIMKMPISNSQRGFSLLELIVATALGVIVILAMTSLFRQGMNATFTVTQRAEVQQNMRAAIEMMTKDLSMAGAGLPTGGLQLATTSGATKVACNQGGTCYVPGDTYPHSSSGAINYMYGVLPGFGNGVQNASVINSAPTAVNDSITSIYCDYNFPLTNFSFTFPTNGYTAAVAPATSIIAGLPTNILAAGGLNVGDLMFFLVSTPGQGTASGSQGTSAAQTAAVVAEITGIPSATAIDFAAADALNFNQTGPNSLYNTVANLGPSLGGGNTVTACRLNAVTYFLQVPPAGGTVQTARLMRQVNGLNAVPVADNIINLQFSYDVINSVNTSITANQSNPIAAGLSPALIQKINMWVMGQSLVSSGSKFQSMYLASSVSARNMSFCNSYSNSSTVCQ